MKRLPATEESLVLRTDFSDAAAWDAVCIEIQEEGDEGFRAYVECVSDPDFAGLSVAQILECAADTARSFLFVVDSEALSNPEHPVLVIDLFEERGRTFRVIPSELWGVENNLSIANMDFCSFADCVDSDGVFRGFPE